MRQLTREKIEILGQRLEYACRTLPPHKQVLVTRKWFLWLGAY